SVEGRLQGEAQHARPARARCRAALRRGREFPGRRSGAIRIMPVQDVSRSAQDILREVFGYPVFRGYQAAIIEHVAAGGDAMVLMPTGGGKSLCYQIPALLRPGLGIVVSPLIALMKDQVDALRQAGVRAAYLNSSLSPGEASDVERAMREGALDLVY